MLVFWASLLQLLMVLCLLDQVGADEVAQLRKENRNGQALRIMEAQKTAEVPAEAWRSLDGLQPFCRALVDAKFLKAPDATMRAVIGPDVVEWKRRTLMASMMRDVRRYTDALQVRREALTFACFSVADTASIMEIIEAVRDLVHDYKYTRDFATAHALTSWLLTDAPFPLAPPTRGMLLWTRSQIEGCKHQYDTALQTIEEARPLIDSMATSHPKIWVGFVQDVSNALLHANQLVRARQMVQNEINQGRVPWNDVMLRPNAFNPNILSKPWHDRVLDYPEVAKIMMRLQQSTSDLLEEYEALVEEQGKLPIQRECIHVGKGHWRYLPVIDSLNVGECNPLTPVACRIVIDELKHVKRAGYSVVEPGTRILPHCGVSNSQIKIHMGLSVVDPSCVSFRIGTEERTPWKEGQAFLFEDAFEHEVSALATCFEPRVIFQVVLRKPVTMKLHNDL